MGKADGSVIIATIIDTDGIEKGTVEIKKELLDVGDSAEKTNKTVGNDLAGGFKKLGKAEDISEDEIKALEDSIKYMITHKYDIDIEELKSVFTS